MTTTWILVANQSNAHLFASAGPGKGLTYLRHVPHPEGHKKNLDFLADKPGRSQDSMHTGGRHSMGKEHDPKDQESLRYAKHLADILTEGRSGNRYVQLVLVSEPRLLGQLRNALDTQTAKQVTASYDKDIADLSEPELQRRLEDLIAH